jgi:hypothetical protein
LGCLLWQLSEEAERMRPILRGKEIAAMRSRRADLVGQYGYSDAARAHESPSGAEIRSAFPVRFDQSFLRRDREYCRLVGQS